jgi:hypothetical protein
MWVLDKLTKACKRHSENMSKYTLVDKKSCVFCSVENMF